MNKRLAAGALAAVSTASVLGVIGAAPAQAAQCGAYPPGQEFVVSSAPGSAYVSKGAIVSLRGTVKRGGAPCFGLQLALYARPFSQPAYRSKGALSTSTSGSIHPQLIVSESVRYYFNLNKGNGTSVRSKISQFVVTP